MKSAETLYNMVVGGEPQAVNYYVNLKRRIADGQKAQLVHDAIQTVHERRKAMYGKPFARGPYVGADYQAGSYSTPNGKVLTPTQLAQLVSLVKAALGGGTAAANPMMASNPMVSQFAPAPPPTSAMLSALKPSAVSFASPIVAVQKKPIATPLLSTPSLLSSTVLKPLAAVAAAAPKPIATPLLSSSPSLTSSLLKNFVLKK
jgi:hypothetical protein